MTVVCDTSLKTHLPNILTPLRYLFETHNSVDNFIVAMIHEITLGFSFYHYKMNLFYRHENPLFITEKKQQKYLQ